MSSYADRIAGAARPSCFGSTQAYSSQDDECRNCRSMHDCRLEIDRKSTSYRPQGNFVPASRLSTPIGRRSREDEDVPWQPGVTHQDEKPMVRLAKDAFVGALRGASKETYEFFRCFRLK